MNRYYAVCATTGAEVAQFPTWSEADKWRKQNRTTRGLSIEVRQSTESEGSTVIEPTSPDNVSERRSAGTLISELTGEDYVTTDEAAAVIAWCRDWVADVEPDGYQHLTTADILRGCDRHIDGGLAFVLADVRRLAAHPVGCPCFDCQVADGDFFEV